VNGIFSSTALWFASRATGVVALVLLTVVLVLGIAVNRHGRLPGLPRFAVTSLHRAVSLLAVAFVAVHILSAIADPYVSIGIAASVIPFVSHYQPFWLGLGAVSIDLMLALTVTSLLRARISRRTWRAVHWLAYVSWPVAFAHSIGSGPDLWRGGLLDLAIACAVGVAGAVAWRAIGTGRETPLAHRAAQVLATWPGRGGPAGPGDRGARQLRGDQFRGDQFRGDQFRGDQTRHDQFRDGDLRPKAGTR
jgi:methionine sulfoxide reductase heme-binding subunit